MQRRSAEEHRSRWSLSACARLVAPVIEWIEEELLVSSMLNKLSLREAVCYTHVPSSHHLSNGMVQMSVVRSVVCYQSQNFLHTEQRFCVEKAPQLISFLLLVFFLDRLRDFWMI